MRVSAVTTSTTSGPSAGATSVSQSRPLAPKISSIAPPIPSSFPVTRSRRLSARCHCDEPSSVVNVAKAAASAGARLAESGTEAPVCSEPAQPESSTVAANNAQSCTRREIAMSGRYRRRRGWSKGV